MKQSVLLMKSQNETTDDEYKYKYIAMRLNPHSTGNHVLKQLLLAQFLHSSSINQ